MQHLVSTRPPSRLTFGARPMRPSMTAERLLWTYCYCVPTSSPHSKLWPAEIHDWPFQLAAGSRSNLVQIRGLGFCWLFPELDTFDESCALTAISCFGGVNAKTDTGNWRHLILPEVALESSLEIELRDDHLSGRWLTEANKPTTGMEVTPLVRHIYL